MRQTLSMKKVTRSPQNQHSKLTQRVEKTFKKQTAQREEEFNLVDLAMHEIQTGFTQWNYLDLNSNRLEFVSNSDDDDTEIRTGGTKLQVLYDQESGRKRCNG